MSRTYSARFGRQLVEQIYERQRVLSVFENQLPSVLRETYDDYRGPRFVDRILCSDA